jgi:hypothetical protein
MFFCLAVVSACEDSQVGMNQACKSNCFILNGIDGKTSEEITAEALKTCEKMGHKGKPQINEQTKSSVAGQCRD